MMRAVAKAAELIRRGEGYIVLELPTGYGKTTAGPALFRAARETGLCWRAIHVFPLRAVLHKTLERFTEEHPDLSFTYQDGDVSLTKKGYVKDPWLSGEYVLTTLDSFAYNLFKIPVAEFYKLVEGRRIHYHIPFAYIYPSCIFFDEAHVAVEGKRSAAVVSAAANALRGFDIPIVVMSATLGKWKYEVFKDFTFVTLGERDCECGGRAVSVHDPKFQEKFAKTKYDVEVIEEGDVAKVARREAEAGKRILVIINDIRRAVELYYELRDLGAVLIHSMLTREDRGRAEGGLGSARVVVGTSAIEAGVDVSFDVLITSADSPESVVQRVGRVCRYGGECRGKIYLFGPGAEKCAEVKEWRLPYKEGSYAPLLSESVEADPGAEWLLTQLASSLYVRQDELRRAFKRYSYSLVRDHALVEVCTDASRDQAKCFSASANRIEFPVLVLKRDGTVEDVDKVDERWLVKYVEEHGEFPALLAKRYVEGVGPVW